MKNNIRFLIYALIVTQTVLPSFTVQNTKVQTYSLVADMYYSSKENEEWEKIKSDVLKNTKLVEIPAFMQQAAIAISNISGTPVDRSIQRIVFERFIKALQGETFESFKIDNKVEFVEILINDRNYSFYPTLSVTVFDQNKRSETIKI
jgi:hypothetical protein